MILVSIIGFQYVLCLTLRKAGGETGRFGKCNSTVGDSTVCFQYDYVSLRMYRGSVNSDTMGKIVVLRTM